MSKLTIGVDLGGTGIKMGVVSSKGRLLETVRFSTPKVADAPAVVGQIAGQTNRLIKKIGPRNVFGIGIGCAGDVDPHTGAIRISPNLGWKNVPLKALLQRRIKTRILVENDANVAAWAAYVMEAKRRVQSLLCVTVGTGIGGGLVINGALYRGVTGSAGEIGHMTLYPEGVPCNCGNHGCVERYVGAKAIMEQAIRAIDAGEKTLITAMVGRDYSKINPLLIATAARKKDRLALCLWDQAGERLGIALASVVNVFNPEWIVLSGGLSRSGRLLLDPIKRTIMNRSFRTPAKAVKLVISKLDQDLGIVGAGLLAHEAFK